MSTSTLSIRPPSSLYGTKTDCSEQQPPPINRVQFHSLFLDNLFHKALEFSQTQSSDPNGTAASSSLTNLNEQSKISLGIDIVCYGAYNAKMAYVLTKESEKSNNSGGGNVELEVIETVEDHVGNLKFRPDYTKDEAEFVEQFQCLIRTTFRCFGKRWLELGEFEKQTLAKSYKLVEVDQFPRVLFEGEQKHCFSMNQIVCAFFATMLKCLRLREARSRNFKKICITLPSDFHSYQRLALKECFDTLGIDNFILVNKSTSLTLPFLTKNLNDTTKKFIVDFGSGYMNCSLVQLTGRNRLQVIDQLADKSISSSRFFEDCFRSLKQKADAQRRPVNETEARYDLYKTMNVEANTGMNVIKENWEIRTGRGVSVELNMKRLGVEQLANAVLEKLKKTSLIDKKTFKIVNEIHDVLICSDAVLYEFLEPLINHYCTGSVNITFVDNDCACLGAAYLASNILNIETYDMVPFPIGIGLYNGVVRYIVDAKTNFPCTGQHMFQTIVDYQDTIRFNLYEGQSPLARNCKHICEIAVENLRRAPTGKIPIEITVEIDQNGVLNAFALDYETKKSLHTYIDINSQSYLRFKRDTGGNNAINIDQKLDRRLVEREESLATFLEDLDYFLDYLKKAYRNSVETDKRLMEGKINLAKRYISKNRLKIRLDECWQLKRELEELIEKRRPMNMGVPVSGNKEKSAFLFEKLFVGGRKSLMCSIL